MVGFNLGLGQDKQRIFTEGVRSLFVREASRLIRIGLVCLGMAVVAIGVVRRVEPVVSADFPLNDGALFAAMTDAVRSARYVLPTFVEYNGQRLPFAYPPLGFYLAGAIADLTGQETIGVLRWLPLVLNLSAMAALAALARVVFKQWAPVLVALVAVAVVPNSYQWLIGGGGLTRSLGWLFALLGLRETFLLTTTRSNYAAARLAVFAGLTALSHLEVAWFLTYSSILFYLALGCTRDNFMRGLVAGLGACAIAAPWWTTVLRIHGPAPFIAAGHTSGSVASQWTVGALVVYGLVLAAQVLSRDIRLVFVGWLGTGFLIDTRSFPWLSTTPIALLIAHFGSAAVNRWLPMLATKDSPSSITAEQRAWTRSRIQWIASIAFTATIPVIVVALAGFRDGANALRPLTAADREAMRWATDNSAPASRFLIISADFWPWDRTGEWFPLLAQRISVATVQGAEWLAHRDFRQTQKWHGDVQRCAKRGSSCLSEWQATTRVEFDFVYVPRRPDDCCAPLRSSLLSDPQYDVAYDGPGATIFRVRSAARGS